MCLAAGLESQCQQRLQLQANQSALQNALQQQVVVSPISSPGSISRCSCRLCARVGWVALPSSSPLGYRVCRYWSSTYFIFIVVILFTIVIQPWISDNLMSYFLTHFSEPCCSRCRPPCPTVCWVVVHRPSSTQQTPRACSTPTMESPTIPTMPGSPRPCSPTTRLMLPVGCLPDSDSQAVPLSSRELSSHSPQTHYFQYLLFWLLLKAFPLYRWV